MESNHIIESFHSAIIRVAVSKLGRGLSEKENLFITQREGFVALEMIHDSVCAATKDELVRYLNSE